MTVQAVSPIMLARQLAIRLYALHPEDRQWLLSQLPSAAREHLSSLLEELTDLGFAPESLTNTPDEIGGSPVPASDEYRDLLDQACPEWLFGQLAKEATPLISVLLRAHPWRWRPALESLLSSRPFAHREPEVMKAGRQIPSALIEILAKRMAGDPAALRTYANEAPTNRTSRISFAIRSGLRKYMTDRKSWTR